MTLICIDGPSGAGKSTAGVWLARRLGLRYLETGYFYRGLALIDLDGDSDNIASDLARLDLEVRVPPDADWRPTLRVDTTDVTDRLRAPEVDAAVRVIASHPPVRRAVADRGRAIAQSGSIVVIGRSTATDLSLPVALALEFTARAEIRTQRRSRADRTPATSVAAESPAPASPSATRIDTSTMTIDQMNVRVLEFAHNAGVMGLGT